MVVDTHVGNLWDYAPHDIECPLSQVVRRARHPSRVARMRGNDSTIRITVFVPVRGNRASSMSREALGNYTRNSDSDGEEWSWRISNDGAGPARDRATRTHTLDDDSGDEEVDAY